jgi:hypothetical protein
MKRLSSSKTEYSEDVSKIEIGQNVTLQPETLETSVVTSSAVVELLVGFGLPPHAVIANAIKVVTPYIHEFNHKHRP